MAVTAWLIPTGLRALDDIAALAGFLADAGPNYITVQTLTSDSGWTAQ